MARPTSYRQKFHCPDLLARSENGESITEICAAWKISRETFYRWDKQFSSFGDAVKKGLELREKWWISIGKAAMLDQATYKGKPIKVNLGFYVWLTKNILGWCDRQSIEAGVTNNAYVPISTMQEVNDPPKAA